MFWKNLFTTVAVMTGILVGVGVILSLYYFCITFGILGVYLFTGLLFVVLVFGTICTFF